MLISLWRPRLQSMLAALLPRVSFDLRQPIDYGEWVCYLPPLANINYNVNASDTALAVQDIVLTIRYRADTKYSDLPLNRMEALAIAIQTRLAREYGDLGDLVKLDVLSLPAPITVSEYGDGLADWLVQLAFAVEIGWNPEIEQGLFPARPPLPAITSIESGLYTERFQADPRTPQPPERQLNPLTRSKYGEIKTKLNP